jgi:hypothetical protein
MEQVLQPKQQQDKSSTTEASSSDSSPKRVFSAAEIALLVGSKPAGPIQLADLDPAGLPFAFSVSAGTAAALLGAGLPAQLHAFGIALWSALPQPRCCNNAACTNLASVSEAKLVAGKASRCSKCKVAK